MSEKEREAKWGPRREVTKSLGARGKSERFILACGHEKTARAGSTWAYCARCLHAAVVGATETGRAAIKKGSGKAPRPVPKPKDKVKGKRKAKGKK